jgi:membrane dipeptidase
MYRREFLTSSMFTMSMLRLAPGAFASKQTSPPRGIGELYKRSVVLDCLCSPANNEEDKLPLKPEILKQCLDSGINAVNWTVSGPTYETTVRGIAYAHGLVDGDPARWLIVRRHGDIEQAKRDAKIALILGFQHPQPVDENLKRLESFHQLGIRIIQLTYNNRGLLGDGCLEPGNAGLSKLGRDAIEQMNALGIAVDASHCGKKTTAEAIAASKKPVLITHSGCNVIHAHPRNKDDEDLRALAERGGVIGIYLMPYLAASPASPTKNTVLQHLEHALKVCGADHVGIGSDGAIAAFDDSPEQKKRFETDMASRKHLGIAAPEEDRFPYVPELNTPQRMLLIAEELHRRGYSDDVIEKVLGRNFQRAFGEIWGDA